jgi:hypothetical protein
MNDNDAERRRFGQRHVQQALASFIHAARARLDELDRDFPAARGAKGEHLPPLVRNGEVAFGLPPVETRR